MIIMRKINEMRIMKVIYGIKTAVFLTTMTVIFIATKTIIFYNCK